MQIHNLKSWAWAYDAVVVRQEKTFEVRNNDRNFQKGDLVVFWEVTSDGLETGVKSKPFLIEYVLTHEQFPDGLQPGYCAFGVVPHQFYSAGLDVPEGVV